MTNKIKPTSVCFYCPCKEETEQITLKFLSIELATGKLYDHNIKDKNNLCKHCGQAWLVKSNSTANKCIIEIYKDNASKCEHCNKEVSTSICINCSANVCTQCLEFDGLCLECGADSIEFKSIEIKTRTLYEIAMDIKSDWSDVYFSAKPYLDAMATMTTIQEDYGLDSGKVIVLYFLANARTWRSETARRIKKELNQMLKEES